jgi:predicted O-methyltransferase YrrM
MIYKNVQGWFESEILFSESVKMARTQSTFVEVGSWKGKSSCYMAEEIKRSGKKIDLFCVDTWEGSAEHANDPTVINGTLFEEFSANVAPFVGIIKPLRMTSLQASNFFSPESIDFLYLDASHDYKSVLDDLEAWFTKLKPGATLAGDDYAPNWDGVVKAVDQFSKENGLKLTIIGHDWVLVK